MKNPPAYPVAAATPEGQTVFQEGMLLLDYFAGIVLSTEHPVGPPKEVAEYCYLVAKTMLEIRTKHIKELESE